VVSPAINELASIRIRVHQHLASTHDYHRTPVEEPMSLCQPKSSPAWLRPCDGNISSGTHQIICGMRRPSVTAWRYERDYAGRAIFVELRIKQTINPAARYQPMPLLTVFGTIGGCVAVKKSLRAGQDDGGRFHPLIRLWIKHNPNEQNRSRLLVLN
jgi:hypothetical protein